MAVKQRDLEALSGDEIALADRIEEFDINPRLKEDYFPGSQEPIIVGMPTRLVYGSRIYCELVKRYEVAEWKVDYKKDIIRGSTLTFTPKGAK